MANESNAGTRDDNKQLGLKATAIKQAICRISTDSPTNARGVIEQYLRCIAPNFKDYGDSYFPLAHRPHRVNPWSYAGDFPPSRETLLCFHIGTTILAYYGAVRANKVTPTLERAVDFLCRLSERVRESYTVIGGLAEGFTLSTPEISAYIEEKYHGVPAPRLNDTPVRPTARAVKDKVPTAPKPAPVAASGKGGSGWVPTTREAISELATGTERVQDASPGSSD